MVKRSHGERWQVVGMLRCGMTQADISRALGMPRSTVCDIVRRYRANPQEVKDLPRSGRPRKTSAREDRTLCRLARRGRTKSSRMLRRLWRLRYPISCRTVRRRLREHRYRACRPLRKTRLTPRHKEVNCYAPTTSFLEVNDKVYSIRPN